MVKMRMTQHKYYVNDDVYCNDVMSMMMKMLLLLVSLLLLQLQLLLQVQVQFHHLGGQVKVKVELMGEVWWS